MYAMELFEIYCGVPHNKFLTRYCFWVFWSQRQCPVRNCYGDSHDKQHVFDSGGVTARNNILFH